MLPVVLRLAVLSEKLLCEPIQILQMWNEQGVAGAIIELGKKMLNLETAPDSAGTMTTMQAAAAMATATLGGPSPSKNIKKKPGASKKPKGGGGKGGLGKLEKEAAAFTADAQNEELKALEAYILKLSQQGEFCKDSGLFQLATTYSHGRTEFVISFGEHIKISGNMNLVFFVTLLVIE